MNNEEQTILIEKYLDRELSEQEREQFEQNLKTDKELARELKLHQAIRETIGDEEMADLTNKLNKITNDYHKKETIHRKIKQLVIYTSGAALIIFLITIISICNKSYTNEELFDQHYEHYDAGTRTRGKEKNTTEIFTNALRTYDNGQYTQAIEQFKQIPETSIYFTPKEFYTALSFMELKNYTEAIKHFEMAVKDEQNVYHDNAVWYCGLCYLKTNQTQKAKQKFQSLNNSCPFYQKKSEEILKNF